MLSPAIPCNFNFYHADLSRMLVRYLQAFRGAVEGLKRYYDNLNPAKEMLAKDITNPTYPYRTFFTTDAPDGPKQEFTYVRRINKLVFLCKLVARPYTKFCVKFVHGDYGEDAHRFSASKGFAPALIAVNDLNAARWRMVVMELLKAEYAPLYDVCTVLNSSDASSVPLKKALLKHIKEMHSAGYVHGDLRSTNVMVRSDGPLDGHFKLIDFDWSGLVGQVHYPEDLNTITVARPPEVVPGGKILEDHDKKMIKDFLFAHCL